jgi:hypothetical protein
LKKKPTKKQVEEAVELLVRADLTDVVAAFLRQGINLRLDMTLRDAADVDL